MSIYLIFMILLQPPPSAGLFFNSPFPAVNGNVIRAITRIAGIFNEATEQMKNDIVINRIVFTFK